MRAGLIVFPGSNCDRDMEVALTRAGARVERVWHGEDTLPTGLDLVAVPGGFSFGDYLRCGAIAARAPLVPAVSAFAESGGHVLGVCNGFQILCEARLLPGTLIRNAGLTFTCRRAALVAEGRSAFTDGYPPGARLTLPVAHHDGNYVAAPDVLDRIEGEGRVAFRYVADVNGSARAIAGVLSANRRVLGLMPHPERAVDVGHGGTDGAALFEGLVRALEPA